MDVLPAFGNPKELEDIEERLAKAPDDIELLFARASMLDLLGRNDEARDAYIVVIKRDGKHLGALGNLGTLLYNAGYRSAARLTYGEALKHHPDDLRMLANFGNALYENEQYAEARVVYERALELDPGYAPAHQGLSHVLERTGDLEAAERHRREGFTTLPISVKAFRGAGMPVSVLVFSSVHRGNVPIDEPLDDLTFLTIRLFTDYYDPELPLPPHDVIFNGIGDADRSDASLAAAARLLEANGASAINDPEAVRTTGRVQIVERLRGIDGLIVPQIDELGRDELDRITRFPVLLRPPGYHTGEFFEMASDRDELARVAENLPGDRLFAIEVLNARGADGHYRKYRVLVVGGILYPIHLARSSKWKVHYFSADQVRTPEAVAEEDAYLRDMRGTLGPRATAALEEAARRIGLEYFGIDFALDARGNVLLFEANATMRAVIPFASDPYPSQTRRQAAIAANAAFRNLVLRAAGKD
ncbi:MAG TPA: tetratricopeptide repeat protein [Candidatus Acidoferrales bacterium]|nr:tetratricopeptide repeat protein [Candidatus Acidoferrales bacterium]